ncbi:Abi family protein [Helcococcus kunzii]|uniref:Abi family protein n=1 Tax=Helcococcus kunzii TaxID=40091 RepID=UPI0024ACFD93|nr:Abi family protein [Helcococcus kunzii]
MRHIRNKHKTKIKGSKQKQELLNMGYYHGYKALRFIKKRENDQYYDNFEQIQAVYNFDNILKRIFYPSLIHIETCLKNRLIDHLVPNKIPSIEWIYNNMLIDYKRIDPNNRKYKKYLNRRLELRNKIDETIAYHYGKGNPIITHFFHNSKPLPLWAYFEVISFGEFGNFMYCLHKDYKIGFAKKLKIHHSGMNQNGRMLENMIFALTSLRNAVMHNSIIFDCRFNNNEQSNQIKTYLINMTGVTNIQFNNIEDFLVLIIFLLKHLNPNKTELRKIVREFESSTKRLEDTIPNSSYFQILGTDINNKLNNLKEYIDKS